MPIQHLAHSTLMNGTRYVALIVVAWALAQGPVAQAQTAARAPAAPAHDSAPAAPAVPPELSVQPLPPAGVVLEVLAVDGLPDAAGNAPAVGSLGSQDSSASTSGGADAASDPSTVSSDAPSGGIGVSGGLGERLLRMPSQQGTRRLGTGAFPVLDIDLHADIVLRRRIVLGTAIRYQTSVGLRASEIPPDQLVANEVALRSSRIEFGVTPGYRFSRRPDGVVLRAFVGWTFRGLHSITPLAVPSYTLHGPVLRLTLQIPLLDGRLVVKLAPELQVVVGVSGSLRNVANASSTGVGWGGEAALEIHASELIYLVAMYRESHARLETDRTGPVNDIERFGTAGVVLHY